MTVLQTIDGKDEALTSEKEKLVHYKKKFKNTQTTLKQMKEITS